MTDAPREFDASDDEATERPEVAEEPIAPAGQVVARPAPVLLTPGGKAVAGLVLAVLSVMGTGPAQEIASAITFPAASTHFYAITGGIQAALAAIAVILATALLRIPDVTEPGVGEVADEAASAPATTGHPASWVLALARAATVVGAIGFVLNVVAVVIALT